MDRIVGDVRDLRELDRMLGVLRDARDLITTRLETAADVWADLYKKPYGECSRCFLVFDTFMQDPMMVRFGTDCTYCGRDAGPGLQVEPASLDAIMRRLDEGIAK